MASQKCRFYRNKFPQVEDVVMVNVKSIAEMGAYVQLLEYDGVEGMILLSELSRRRIRSLNRLIRVGRQECVVVLRVDQDKGYIDLSKRRVAAEDIKKCEDRYNKSKAVHSILSHAAEDVNMNLEELYERTVWKLEDKFGGPGTSYDAIKKAIIEDSSIFDTFDLDEEQKAAVVKRFRQKMTPQAVKIRSDIEVTCYAYEGVDAVKDALRAGLATSSEEFPVKISLVAPPLYTISTTALDRPGGIAKLNECIDAIREVITAKKGNLSIELEPRAVTEDDDAQLASMLENAERQNLEIDGDGDDSEEDDESKA